VALCRGSPDPLSVPTRRSSDLAADAVVLVHDRRTFAQLAQVADDRLGLAPGALAAARLRGALGEQLALGEDRDGTVAGGPGVQRSEEHTSELQSRENLVCRRLL